LEWGAHGGGRIVLGSVRRQPARLEEPWIRESSMGVLPSPPPSRQGSIFTSPSMASAYFSHPAEEGR
jgi:hypothetical protein